MKSSYRWAVLAAFMLVTFVNQASWITFAPVTGEAARHFATTDLVIGLLSMVFMIVYVLLAVPAAWLIDTRGFRPAVAAGALLTAAGALVRGLFSGSLGLVFAGQVLIAVGQPLVLGSITSLAACWFPARERATAAGLATLSIYLGILTAMLLTPALLLHHGMRAMLLCYAAAACAAAVLFLALARQRAADTERVPMFEGLRSSLRNRDFLLLLVIFFVGLGLFNGVTTWIEAIVRPRGFGAAQAGLLGGVMLLGGILGAVVMPLASDALRRRKPFILLSLFGLLPGLAGVACARSFALLLASGAWFGFFLLAAGPVGFQYGAELTRPAPEGTSNSLLVGMGQVSGILFIFAMDALPGDMTVSLVVLLGLTAAAGALACLLRESPLDGSAG